MLYTSGVDPGIYMGVAPVHIVEVFVDRILHGHAYIKDPAEECKKNPKNPNTLELSPPVRQLFLLETYFFPCLCICAYIRAKTLPAFFFSLHKNSK